ncbi:MAG: hypothetical protein EOP06_08965 [Proteobacteria bacterium]|nr:MAG: hypothetical protein EOP06_08965 [Pseudomonadota bacterium]
MSPEALKEALEDVTRVRAKLRAAPRLQLEFKALVSKLLREHGVEIKDQTLSSITIAVYPELSSTNIMVDPILPVPDLGPAPR